MSPEFSEAVNRAKALRARWWEERAREVALKGGPGGQATMVIFGLKNHAPDDFKEVERREHTGKGGGPILTMTPEEQRAETERRRAAAKALVEAAFVEHQRRESDAAEPGLPT